MNKQSYRTELIVILTITSIFCFLIAYTMQLGIGEYNQRQRAQITQTAAAHATIQARKITEANAPHVQKLAVLTYHLNDIRSLAFSQDGSIIASLSSDNIVVFCDPSILGVNHKFYKPNRWIMDILSLPDGMIAITWMQDGTTELWEPIDDKLISTLEGQTDFNSTFSISSEGIIAGGVKNKIKLWKVSNGKLIHTIEGHGDEIKSLAFSPDGKLLASGSQDGTVRVWEIESGRSIYTLSQASPVLSIAFSPSGFLLAAGSKDGKILLWDLNNGKLARVLKGHRYEVNSVDFSPDGSLLISGSMDATLRIWNVKNGSLLNTLSGHFGIVTSVAFSPDQMRIASGSTDSDTFLWGIP